MRLRCLILVLGGTSLIACGGTVGDSQTGADSASMPTTSSGTSKGGESQGDSGTTTTTGDGDGDMNTTGDGDGEPTTTAGDGDPAGDGDGDSGTKFDLGDNGDGDGDTTGGEDDSDIEVIVTADNAYGFGYGTSDGIDTYFGGIENTTAGQIFNCNGGPEEYLIPSEVAENATYLYIIGYADSSVTQGVLGRFRRIGGVGGFGETVYTGDPSWEVCATGMNYSPPGGGPDEATITAMILACNDDQLDPATTSVGWVDSVGTQYGALAIGEDNTTPYNGGPMIGNEFPITCQMKMDDDARWMWFNWDPDNIEWPQQSPFLWPGGGTNPDHQFLLFRIAAAALPPPPT